MFDFCLVASDWLNIAMLIMEGDANAEGLRLARFLKLFKATRGRSGSIVARGFCSRAYASHLHTRAVSIFLADVEPAIVRPPLGAACAEESVDAWEADVVGPSFLFSH